jgi:hypothetical protein
MNVRQDVAGARRTRAPRQEAADQCVGRGRRLALEHWKAVGLRYPSTVRISNIVAVEKKIIKHALGTVHADDLADVERGLRLAFGL